MTKQNNIGNRIHSCYSGTIVPEDIKACTIEETQQKYRRGTAITRLLPGAGVLKIVLLDPNPRPLFLHWFEAFGPYVFALK